MNTVQNYAFDLLNFSVKILSRIFLNTHPTSEVLSLTKRQTKLSIKLKEQKCSFFSLRSQMPNGFHLCSSR